MRWREEGGGEGHKGAWESRERSTWTELGLACEQSGCPLRRQVRSNFGFREGWTDFVNTPDLLCAFRREKVMWWSAMSWFRLRDRLRRI